MAGVKDVGDLMHRTFFRTLSLLGSRGQGALLRRYFDWWHRNPDPWHMGTDAYEQAKYAATLAQIPDRPYGRILEVGCSEGVFTKLLTEAYPDADITGLDISERALSRAAERVEKASGRTRLLAADILTFTSEHRYDLVFCAETLYYLGRRDRLKRASEQLAGLLGPGGVLVLVHPWPEARRLHRFVHASPLSQVSERVETTAHRPFSVCVYQARPTGSTGAA
ncbi:MULTISPECIES: class I SAM-dependent methyltransferase [Nonomuraea]|uniref:Class I SAM-dependent methyltransferase n=1 Tax=Nonomuraea ferruginea TaxID=46174 RepID=A0ABT4T428_9ACTN|nr:class I SAM-dependent methyltransferase [Nonomuraea ferruginea]MDA0644242.1 class I SAM-dependent methyltransferase [Nonomuraea ferruginea]